MAHRFAPWLLAVLLAACSLPPMDAERVTLASRDAAFIDEIGVVDPLPVQSVYGYALWPDAAAFAPPWPAMVVLHSSNGQGAQDWFYARRLRDMGVAVLAVDSFSPRGVEKTIEDQTLVSEASMMADAYAALAWLAGDARIAARRIGVLGFSKGGIAALYAGFQRYRDAFAAAPDQAFALHIAYYPWCGVRLLDARTTGAPMIVQTGELDMVAPPRLCTEFLDAVQGADPAAQTAMHIHPGARHAFDHPMLEMFGRLPITGATPNRCRFQETTPGVFSETYSGRIVNGANLGEVLAGCSAEGAVVGGDADAAEAAWAITEAAVRRHLAP